MNGIKFLSFALIVILVVNLIFLALGWLNPFWFFAVVIVIGVIAFKGIPFMRKQ